MSRKTIYIFFSLFLIVFLSGCSFKKEVKEDISWEEEVLMAEECGMDGLKCCVEDPVCRYGQNCCEALDGSQQNYCADSCDFGTQNNFCRKDNPKCDEDLVCFDSYCLSCGEEDELCCENNLCDNDLVCHNNKCVSCGLSGNPCCESALCSNEDLRLECNKGICQECGFSGKSICANEPFCNLGHLQNNNVCLECGKINLPCCDIKDNIISCEDGLVCDKGFCNSK
jgi:hypothetical protein